MGYTLLTGATGLLGRYLLRDLLVAGERVAVLTRDGRRASALQRIEDILNYWDGRLGRRLPRPVVLVGDINQPGCGLGADEINWLSEGCNRVLHSAASLAFVEEPQTGEPARSNVGGVRNVLDLCRSLRDPHLVHISTAYVCGRTTGVFYEHQLDQGQAFANPYEASKAEAERRVRAADGLRGFTILRPSIIAGDSRTGYASTYHGFYAPLRVLQALASHGLLAGAGGGSTAIDYLSALGLDGGETKNFVPVDWVSDAAIKVLARQGSLNQTYALVSDRPLPVRDLQDGFEQAVVDYLAARPGAKRPPLIGAAAGSNPAIEQEFRAQFKTYESYWRDDCVFDRAAADRLLGDTPCPVFDREMVVRLSRAALEANFGFPVPPPARVDFWVEPWLAGLGPSRGAGSERLTVRALGPGGGVWTLDEHGCRRGESDAPATLSAPVAVLARLAVGETTLPQACDGGDALVTGADALRLAPRLLPPVTAPPDAQPAPRAGAGPIAV